MAIQHTDQVTYDVSGPHEDLQTFKTRLVANEVCSEGACIVDLESNQMTILLWKEDTEKLSFAARQLSLDIKPRELADPQPPAAQPQGVITSTSEIPKPPDDDIRRTVQECRTLHEMGKRWNVSAPTFRKWISQTPESGYGERRGRSTKRESTSVPAETQATEDLLYDQAKRIVVEAGQASASMLQRELKIGYSRAARLVSLLEDKGVVGPGEGAKPRMVLASQDRSGGPGDMSTVQSIFASTLIQRIQILEGATAEYTQIEDEIRKLEDRKVVLQVQLEALEEANPDLCDMAFRLAQIKDLVQIENDS